LALVEDRITSLENRMAKIEGVLEQMSVRLDRLEARFDHLETRFDQLMMTKADKWEVRLWFMVMTAFLTSIVVLLGVILARILAL